MRRRFVIFVASVVLLSAAIPALAHIRRIQGKVVDEDGKPVLGAVIEVVLVSLADAAFAVRNNDQTWRGQTNASGEGARVFSGILNEPGTSR